VRLIVGLGNPGAEYERTRHNVGFMVADALAARHASGQTPKGRFHAATLEARMGGGKALLMKPTTYMNRSGQAVSEAVRFYKMDPAEDLLVIVDDVSLPCGSIRIRGSGSPGGHNGLDDIERRLGSRDYARCRVGIDPPPGPTPQRDYVLGRFSPEQKPAIERAIEQAADAAEAWAIEGLDAAMNKFNTRRSERAGAAAGDVPDEQTQTDERSD